MIRKQDTVVEATGVVAMEGAPMERPGVTQMATEEEAEVAMAPQLGEAMAAEVVEQEEATANRALARAGQAVAAVSFPATAFLLHAEL